jgi:orotidine-5'-phosphate decarboxylase
MGEDFLLVTPGIRPTGFSQGDQQRVMTPAEAKQAGVSYIVVGRPITQSDNPVLVIDQINLEL